MARAGAVPGLVDIGNWTAGRALNGFTTEEIGELMGFLKRIGRNLGA